MTVFQLNADFTFEAECIDDAFTKLAAHFVACRDGDTSHLILSGKVSIDPKEKPPAP